MYYNRKKGKMIRLLQHNNYTLIEMISNEIDIREFIM